MLSAISKSDGTRGSVISEVYKTKVTNGLIGSFSLNANGDLSGASGASVLYTIYVGKGNNLVTFVNGVGPVASLTQAARKEAAG